MNEPRFVIYTSRAGRFLITDTKDNVVMDVEDTLEDADAVAHAHNTSLCTSN
jgi:hypothetical protein